MTTNYDAMNGRIEDAQNAGANDKWKKKGKKQKTTTRAAGKLIDGRN